MKWRIYMKNKLLNIAILTALGLTAAQLQADESEIDIPDENTISAKSAENAANEPNPDWEDDIFTDITDIRQDIRLNDLHLLFSNGMLWEAQLETYTSTNIIDSLSLEFIYLENIETCQIALKINGEELEIDPFENKMEMQVDFNGTIPIEIKVSEICFQ